MRFFFASLALLAVIVALAGCSQSSSHPPITQGCEGPLCYPAAEPGALPVTDGGVTEGGTGEGGSSDSGPGDSGGDDSGINDSGSIDAGD